LETEIKRFGRHARRKCRVDALDRSSECVDKQLIDRHKSFNAAHPYNALPLPPPKAKLATTPALELAAAQAFVAASAAPGTPIRVAEAALSRAGVYCHGVRVVNGVVSCTLTSVAADSGNDSQHEVTRRVQITPDANGAVAAATVGRITDGF
jgi:hypothetical protein